ncbi:SLOG family protein [Tuberibacillus sp. Marseille-P3662]|uniref:SLOG family protein n=1 Tax=Tuberibacillus sp. Marseille-P3662 TaxID=1965358 RepID=UPI000A1CD355|nr:DUF1273 domain-containing protein [Tuberibacillus sp. Marseille-P3662]
MGQVYVITGYKPKELGIFSNQHQGIEVIKHAIKMQLIQLLDYNLEWVLTSGQSGVELWACDVVLDLKQDYPELKLSILTPFLEQESMWPDVVKEQYTRILSTADHVDSITKRPYEHPSQLRLKNDFLIRKSDGLLIIYDEETPGSPDYYLQPAENKASHSHYPIITINRFDLDVAAQDLQELDPNYWSQ